MRFKKTISILTSSFTMLLLFSSAMAAEKKTNVEVRAEETLVEDTTPHSSRNAKKTPATTEKINTYTTTTTTTEVKPRAVLDEETLKKISNTLCSEGFKAYVGNDKKNVCQSRASSPDLAYSCVWNKKGPVAYAPSEQGPCRLDFSEHKGSVIITKENYKERPPLDYGMEAQCCFRAAQGTP